MCGRLLTRLHRILAHLLQHPKKSDYRITIYLRSAEKAKGFGKLGFKTALGSLDDVELLEKLAAGFDIIFQTVGPLWIISSFTVPESCR